MTFLWSSRIRIAQVLALVALLGASLAWAMNRKPVLVSENCYLFEFANLQKKEEFPLRGAELAKLVEKFLASRLGSQEDVSLRVAASNSTSTSFCVQLRRAQSTPELEKLLAEDMKEWMQAGRPWGETITAPTVYLVSHSLTLLKVSFVGLCISMMLLLLTVWGFLRLLARDETSDT
jgi:hypothetical protein